MSAAQPQPSPNDAPRSATMWVVTSDAQIRQVVENAVQDYPLHVSVCVNFSEDFRPPITGAPPDIVLINLIAPTESCFSLLPNIRRQWPNAHVIYLSHSDDIHLWAKAIQLGAYEFLPSSVEPHQLGWVLQGALWTSRRAVAKA